MQTRYFNEGKKKTLTLMMEKHKPTTLIMEKCEPTTLGMLKHEPAILGMLMCELSTLGMLIHKAATLGMLMCEPGTLGMLIREPVTLKSQSCHYVKQYKKHLQIPKRKFDKNLYLLYECDSVFPLVQVVFSLFLGANRCFVKHRY